MFKRELYLNKIRPDYDTEAIKYITGVRMAGKTSLIKSIIEELIESGIKSDHIILYDLEDKSNCGPSVDGSEKRIWRQHSFQ